MDSHAIMLRSLPSMIAVLLALASAACAADGSDTDAEATAGSTTSTAPTSGGEIDLTCASYCTAITAHCTAGNAQYTGMTTCMGSCQALAVGAAADIAGNTLGCRLYHANVAKDAPDVHCPHAGPGGADVCGSNCDGFCTIAADACPGTFADDAACQTACAGYDKGEAYDAADMAGDSFACRLYHLTVASTPLAMHCPHILPDSVPCGG